MRRFVGEFACVRREPAELGWGIAAHEFAFADGTAAGFDLTSMDRSGFGRPGADGGGIEFRPGKRYRFTVEEVG